MSNLSRDEALELAWETSFIGEVCHGALANVGDHIYCKPNLCHVDLADMSQGLGCTPS